MGNLKLTVYEIVGYLAPGVVGVAAIGVFFWAVFIPAVPLRITSVSLSKEEWVALLFACYTIGHAVQGLCNLHPSPEKLAEKRGDRQQLIESAKAGLSRTCCADLTNYSLKQIAGLSQTSLLRSGNTEDHDVFLYREGYYRGSSGSFTLLAVALVIRACRGSVSVIIAGSPIVVPIFPLSFFALLSLGIAVVFYRRYRRFGEYRLDNLLHCACLPAGAETE